MPKITQIYHLEVITPHWPLKVVASWMIITVSSKMEYEHN